MRSLVEWAPILLVSAVVTLVCLGMRSGSMVGVVSATPFLSRSKSAIHTV